MGDAAVKDSEAAARNLSIILLATTMPETKIPMIKITAATSIKEEPRSVLNLRFFGNIFCDSLLRN